MYFLYTYYKIDHLFHFLIFEIFCNIHFCIINVICLISIISKGLFLDYLFISSWSSAILQPTLLYVQSFFVSTFLDFINRDMAFLDGTTCLIAAVFFLTLLLVMTMCTLSIPFVLPCLSRPSNMATTILPFSSSLHRNKLAFTCFLSVSGKSLSVSLSSQSEQSVMIRQITACHLQTKCKMFLPKVFETFLLQSSS